MAKKNTGSKKLVKNVSKELSHIMEVEKLLYKFMALDNEELLNVLVRLIKNKKGADAWFNKIIKNTAHLINEDDFKERFEMYVNTNRASLTDIIVNYDSSATEKFLKETNFDKADAQIPSKGKDEKKKEEPKKKKEDKKQKEDKTDNAGEKKEDSKQEEKQSEVKTENVLDDYLNMLNAAKENYNNKKKEIVETVKAEKEKEVKKEEIKEEQPKKTDIVNGDDFAITLLGKEIKVEGCKYESIVVSNTRDAIVKEFKLPESVSAIFDYSLDIIIDIMEKHNNTWSDDYYMEAFAKVNSVPRKRFDIEYVKSIVK